MEKKAKVGSTAGCQTIVLAKRTLPVAVELHALDFLSLDDLSEVLSATKDLKALVQRFIRTHLRTVEFRLARHRLLRLVLRTASRLLQLSLPLRDVSEKEWTELAPLVAACVKRNSALLEELQLGSHHLHFDQRFVCTDAIWQAIDSCSKLHTCVLSPPANVAKRFGSSLVIGRFDNNRQPELKSLFEHAAELKTVICNETRSLSAQEWKACTALQSLVLWCVDAGRQADLSREIATIVEELPTLTWLSVGDLMGDLSQFDWHLPELKELRMRKHDQEGLFLPEITAPKLAVLDLPAVDDPESEMLQLTRHCALALQSVTIREQFNEDWGKCAPSIDSSRNLHTLHLLSEANPAPPSFAATIGGLRSLRDLSVVFQCHVQIGILIGELLSSLCSLESASIKVEGELLDGTITLPEFPTPEHKSRLRKLTLSDSELLSIGACDLPALEELCLTYSHDELRPSDQSSLLDELLSTTDGLKSLTLFPHIEFNLGNITRHVMVLRDSPLNLPGFKGNQLHTLKLSSRTLPCAQAVAMLATTKLPVLEQLYLPVWRHEHDLSQASMSGAGLFDLFLQQLPLSDAFCALIDALPALRALYWLQPRVKHTTGQFLLSTFTVELLKLLRPQRFPKLSVITNFPSVQGILLAPCSLPSERIERLQVEFPMIGFLNRELGLLTRPWQLVGQDQLLHVQQKSKQLTFTQLVPDSKTSEFATATMDRAPNAGALIGAADVAAEEELNSSPENVDDEDAEAEDELSESQSFNDSAEACDQETCSDDAADDDGDGDREFRDIEEDDDAESDVNSAAAAADPLSVLAQAASSLR